jgi:hypothetical protein
MTDMHRLLLPALLVSLAMVSVGVLAQGDERSRPEPFEYQHVAPTWSDVCTVMFTGGVTPRMNDVNDNGIAVGRNMLIRAAGPPPCWYEGPDQWAALRGSAYPGVGDCAVPYPDFEALRITNADTVVSNCGIHQGSTPYVWQWVLDDPTITNIDETSSFAIGAGVIHEQVAPLTWLPAWDYAATVSSAAAACMELVSVTGMGLAVGRVENEAGSCNGVHPGLPIGRYGIVVERVGPLSWVHEYLVDPHPSMPGVLLKYPYTDALGVDAGGNVYGTISHRIWGQNTLRLIQVDRTEPAVWTYGTTSGHAPTKLWPEAGEPTGQLSVAWSSGNGIEEWACTVPPPGESPTAQQTYKHPAYGRGWGVDGVSQNGQYAARRDDFTGLEWVMMERGAAMYGAPHYCDVDGDGRARYEDRWEGDATTWSDRDVDGDADHIFDWCIHKPNAGQSDVDTDGVADYCDWDADGDKSMNGFYMVAFGVLYDPCPYIAGAAGDVDLTAPFGVGDACHGDPDTDGDGVPSTADNCDFDPAWPWNGWNEDQAWYDELDNLSGDACDNDDDKDFTADSSDNCRLKRQTGPTPYPDDDADGIGNFCDIDWTGDWDSDTLIDYWDQFPIDPVRFYDFDSDRESDQMIGAGADNCPFTWNPRPLPLPSAQPDVDADGIGDACDPNADGDARWNYLDNCWLDWQFIFDDTDGDGEGDSCDPFGLTPLPDIDGDGWSDVNDNCPVTANPDQMDSDRDGLGDACDPAYGVGGDRDADGVRDEVDNCPDEYNPSQWDQDGDGTGDACEADSDGDGVDDNNDNCPATPNPGQSDWDSDGTGDACDDTDGDGVNDDTDNCVSTSNAGQADWDSDGTGDACDDTDGDGVNDDTDNCLITSNPSQGDWDSDSTGDACEDSDGDGHNDDVDNCPGAANPTQGDMDSDGIGDACDDSDGDGIDDDVDNCPATPNPGQSDWDSDGTGDACDDTDGDGVNDDTDNCVSTSNAGQTDTDADGAGDACDSDADGDGIEDAAEPGICAVENQTTPADGWCTDMGTNYHPPGGP